ncbi:MAG TPA: hypothetical protein V6D00_06795 [Pantanalinema sp.]
MLSSIQGPSPQVRVSPAPRQLPAPVAAPGMAPDSLSLSKPAANAARPTQPAHNGGWDDLTNLVPVMVFSPIASVAAAGIGFLVAGPVGAAVGAIAGGSTLGGLLGLKNLIHHVAHRAKGEETDDDFNLKLAGKLLVTPGTTLLGAGAGFMVGGPIGAAVGAMIGATGLMLVGMVKGAFKKLTA